MDFNQLVESFIIKLQTEPFAQATISHPRRRSSPLKRVRLRPVELRGKLYLQFEYQYEQKIQHENKPINDIEEEIQILLEQFRQIHATFEQSILHVQISKRYKAMWREKRTKQKQKIQTSHDRKKQYLLSEHKVYPFLVHLGVQTKEGKIKRRHYDKFKQINRFIEFIDDTLDFLPKNRQINIVDFGSGKSYLTFALYHYLHIEKGLDIKVTGLDLKADVIQLCSTLAKDLNYKQLSFEVGNIHEYTTDETIDMVVSLHACDIATDMAIAQAVKWNAKVILCVPCCQQEIRNQIQSKELEIMLKHGLIKERFSSLATDSIRAELLSLVGYDTQLLEFISMEHTPKNILIRAYYTGKSPTAKQIEKYKEFCDLIKAKPFLEKELSSQLENLNV